MNEAIPIKYPFTFPVRVRFADTDLQGHVFFGNYFTYCDEGFMAYLDDVGYSWGRLGSMGLELYYVESTCQFKGRAFLADILDVNTRIAELGRSAMTAEMMISKSNKDEIVAIGRITAVMVSKKTGKSTPIPAELRAAIKQV
ncbi:MAG TPA: thioesterase family protein [Desulfosporosinus sp.]|nr:thioesterase family protein [Desulfosporosinus sp.]